MSTKPNTGAFDFSAMMADWPKPAFSNWAFAEREDKIEARTVAGFQKMGETMWAHAEKTLDDHMDFFSHRLHEDFECAKSLSRCSAPEEAMATLQAFYSKMATEYQEHIEKQSALIRDSFSDNAAVVEELSETALENVSELTRAAEENIDETRPASRRKRATPAKS